MQVQSRRGTHSHCLVEMDQGGLQVQVLPSQRLLTAPESFLQQLEVDKPQAFHKYTIPRGEQTLPFVRPALLVPAQLWVMLAEFGRTTSMEAYLDHLSSLFKEAGGRGHIINNQ